MMRVRREPRSSIRRARFPRRTLRLRLTLLYGALFIGSGAGLLAITYGLVAHANTSGPFTTGDSVPPSALPPDTATSPTANLSAAGLVQDQQDADLHQLLRQSEIALAIMTVVSVSLGWIVAGRVLRPLRVITATTRLISEHNLGERLALEGPSDELKDLADTIDGLLGRLEGAFDAQRRFVANASHELRTPLAVSRAMLQVSLADPDLTLDALRSTCTEVLESERRQDELIEALLTLARSERGLDHRETFDVATIAGDVVHRCEQDLTAIGLSLECNLVPAMMTGDKRLIERLVANLMDNAIRHNIPGGHVRIQVAQASGAVVLRVANSGSVLTSDQVERLLQPFQRLKPDRGGDHDGLGLGLSIVSAIARAHHATLNAQPGRSGGLDVEISFPPAELVRV